MKFHHKYKCKEDILPYSISFVITTKENKYGHYEEYYDKKDKYRLLRGLVLTKQRLIKCLTELND